MTIKQESAPLSKADSIIEDSSKAKAATIKKKIPLSEHYQKTTIKRHMIEASSLSIIEKKTGGELPSGSCFLWVNDIIHGKASGIIHIYLNHFTNHFGYLREKSSEKWKNQCGGFGKTCYPLKLLHNTLCLREGDDDDDAVSVVNVGVL
nr:hypothetical protein [Tanacetum cinerariifolium]